MEFLHHPQPFNSSCYLPAVLNRPQCLFLPVPYVKCIQSSELTGNSHWKEKRTEEPFVLSHHSFTVENNDPPFAEKTKVDRVELHQATKKKHSDMYYATVFDADDMKKQRTKDTAEIL